MAEKQYTGSFRENEAFFALAFFAPMWYHIRAAQAAIQVSLENHLKKTRSN